MERRVETGMFGFNKTDTQSDNKTDIDTPVQIEEEMLSADEGSFAGDFVDAAAGSEAVSHQLSYLSKEQIVKPVPSRIVKPSTISEGFELTGEITSQGNLQVEGKVNGNIQAENLSIGSKGVVKGSVKCHSLTIKGEFSGEASCDQLNLSGNAVVNGDIQYRSLTMTAGAILMGTVTRY